MAVSKRKIDLDDLARRAKSAPKDGKLVVVGSPPAPEGPPDLTAADLPLGAFTWHVLVEPRRPKTHAGVIELAGETKTVEEMQTAIGRVLVRGALFGNGVAASGLRMNDDPSFAAIKAGDFVMYARHTGQVVKVLQHWKGKDYERRILAITDTELLCPVSDPERIRYWI